jgi:hypothetical protein
MKTLRGLIISSVMLLTSVAAFSQAASHVSATGQVFAEVIPTFSASETSSLNFGRFSPGAQGGKIILTPQGTIHLQGSVYKAPGSFNPGSFMVTGDENITFSIKLPASPIILRNISDARTLVVDDWKSNPEEGIGTGMLQNGYQLINVGATLNVGTVQDNPAGIYSGSYNITFEFY